MGQYCIQLINPNTCQSMTENMASAARSVAAPDTRILAVSPDSGSIPLKDILMKLLRRSGYCNK